MMNFGKGKEIFSKVLESVFNKIGDKLGEKLVNFALAEKDMVTFASLKENVKRLSAIQFDVDEEIKKAELLGNKKRKREVGEWLEAVQIVENEFRQLENEPSEEFIQQFFSGGRAAELDARIRELVQQRQYFSEVVVVSESKGETLLTCGLVGKEFEKNLKKIVKFLLENDGLCIGICGMGGIGKTTLAKHINNKLLDVHSAYCVSWIVVSQEFRVTSLQDNIAKDLGLDLSDERNEDKRASRLHKVLSEGQNRLLIFDDMWEAINLEKVGIPLVFGRCKLMITTRSRDVCQRMSCKQVVEVKTLDNEEAWNLFSEKLGQGVKLTPEVQEIAKSMVEFCDGLPLGIVTLAGSMRGESSKNVWSDELEKLKESMMEQEDMQEKVFKVLKYSFDRLGERDGNHNGYSKLQKCFLHCSLYPEDHEINREDLIRLFILEKFLDKRKSREKLFVQGHAILDKLVHACLLEMVGDRVKMHDLVRAMALELRKGKTKAIAGQYLNEIPNGEEWTKDLENMSLMENNIRQIPEGMSSNCSKLKTLLLSSNPLQFIPESFFLKMCNLCVLDLSRTSIEKLPNSLCKLEKLEALLLDGCTDLKFIPSLEKLKQLRELDVFGTAICKVDMEMAIILNRESLSLHDMPGSEIVPRSLLLNFQYLQCLHLPYHVEAPVEDIMQLNHLDEFHGRVKDASEFNKLVSKTRLYDIVVSSSDMLYDVCGRSTQGSFSRYIDKKQGYISVKQDTQPLQLNSGAGRCKSVVENFAMMNAKDLTVSRCNELECIWRREQLVTTSIVASTSSSPIPPNSILFSSLTELNISDCKKMKKMGLKASELLNIKSIHIRNCEAIEELLEAERGNGGEATTVSIVSLSKLTRLNILKCKKMKKLRLTASHLSSIEHIIIWNCGAIEELLEEDSSSEGEVVSLSKLTSLEIQYCEKMKKLRLTASQLPSIEHISIWNCGAIEELLEKDSSSEGEVVSLSKLTSLNIQSCEKMQKLRLTASQLPSIEHIFILNCGAIEELLEEDSSSEGEVVSLSKLTRLNIQSCEKMKKLRLTASQLPSIKDINIWNCGSIEELLEEDNSSEGEVVSLSKLTSLIIRNCEKMKKLRLTASQLPNIERINIENCGAIEELLEEDSSSEGEVVSLSKLTSLIIRNCEKMKKLRLIASQLPSIERIDIENCGAIEELLEEDSSSEGEVVSLSKLTSLIIRNCEKMKKVRLRGSQLPKIKCIRVQFCAAIEELLEAESGSRREDTTISFVSLPKLKVLSIHFCEKMKSISSGTTIACPSIEMIGLRRCPLLKKLPLIFGEPNLGDSLTPLALQKIRLRSDEKEWWERMELEYPTYHHLLQSFLYFDDFD